MEEEYLTHPGEVIEELLKKHHMTQLELASRINISLKHVNQIIHQKKSVTADMSSRLACVFGVSPAFFLQLQCRYDLERQELKTIMVMTDEEKKIASHLPYDKMLEWGYAPKKNIGQEEQVLYFRNFIGVSNLLNVPKYLESIIELQPEWPRFELALWLKMGHWEASRMEVNDLDLFGLKQAFNQMKTYMKLPLEDVIIPLSNFLGQYGVALCFIPTFSKLESVGFISYLEHGIVLAMAEDFKYEDEFWLRLFQMLGELFYQRSSNLYLAFRGQFSNKADSFAKKQIISPREYQRLLEDLSIDHILDVASEKQLLIGQLLGVLIDDGYLDKNEYAELRRKKPSYSED